VDKSLTAGIGCLLSPLPDIGTNRDASLLARLKKVCQKAEVAGVALVMIRGDHSMSASINFDEAQASFDETSPVLTACVTRAITATILAKTCARLGISLDTPLAAIHQLNWKPHAPLWATVRLAELLNHTHGLEIPLLSVPRDGNGFIDSARLMGMIGPYGAPERRSQKLYCYRPAGPWIAASVSEQLLRCRFADLVEQLFDSTCGLPDGKWDPLDICPASGGSLKRSAIDLARLLKLHIGDPTMRELRRFEAQFPGWSPGRLSACCGWFSHGDGWYGATTQGLSQDIILRFHPERGIGIVVTSAKPRAPFYVLGGLFGHMLPEFRGDWAEAVTVNTTLMDVKLPDWRHEGKFDNPQTTMRTHYQEDGRLHLEVSLRMAGVQRKALWMGTLSPMKASEPNVYRVTPSRWPMSGFVQFVDDFRGLWDGRDLWFRDEYSASKEI
jgi:CubicO group peptidase (beta-lactamase class C family)